MELTQFLGGFLVLTGYFSATHQACVDLDTTACQLMIVQNPNLCSNPTLSMTACPKFCNLCNTLTALECYHCNATVDEKHLCTTTKTCAAGEVCMKKSVTSIVDGHHEYQLSCEPKNHCDGKDLILSFGKRGLDVRDLSISCCDHNLCNSITAVAPPSHTTTPPITACKKDVTVVIENSEKSRDDVSPSDVNNFLVDVVSGLAIGQDAVLMSVAKFADHSDTLWKLDTYTDKSNLTAAINGLHLLRDHDHTELHEAFEYVLHHQKDHGHRPDAGDVIIIITNDVSDGVNAHHLANTVDQNFNDVIFIGIDEDIATDHGIIHVGTDSRHEFMMTQSGKLQGIVSQIISLICQ